MIIGHTRCRREYGRYPHPVPAKPARQANHQDYHQDPQDHNDDDGPEHNRHRPVGPHQMGAAKEGAEASGD